MDDAQMDLQSLANLFATTYNPDPNVQKTGELQIRKAMSYFIRPAIFVLIAPADRCTGGHAYCPFADHRI
jgi:hypothetical protein